MNDGDMVKELMSIKKFKDLLPIQKEALSKGILDPETNMVVISATASGKTFVAEMPIYKHLKNDGKVLYLIPQTALIGDKLRDLEYLGKQGYQIATAGENSSDADVLITTFEAFYRGAIRNLESYKRFGLVVLDEFHLLYDQNRGFNLEKAIVLIKEWNPKILCLSATFKKVEDATGWLNAKVVENNDRPIPITEDILDLTGSKSGAKDLAKAIYEKIKAPCIIFCGNVQNTRNRAEELADLLRKIGKGKPIIDVSTEDERINGICIAHPPHTSFLSKVPNS